MMLLTTSKLKWLKHTEPKDDSDQIPMVAQSYRQYESMNKILVCPDGCTGMEQMDEVQVATC